MSDLPAPTFIISAAKDTWIVNELARLQSKLAVQVKFKESWGEKLEDLHINAIMEKNDETIKELSRAYHNSIDSHPMGDARKRMDEYQKIKDECMEGVFAGIDNQGNAQVKQDFKTALEAIKACRDEQMLEKKYNLELLKILASTGNLNKGPVATENTATEHMEETVDAEVSTDNDQYFEEE